MQLIIVPGLKSTFSKLSILLMMSLSILSTVDAKIIQKNKKQLQPSINIKVENKLNLERKDVLVSIPIHQLKKKYSNFNEETFIIFDGKNEVPSQLEDVNGDKIPDNILMLLNLVPHETKRAKIQYGKLAVSQKDFKKRTQAVLATKINYLMKEGYYTCGEFQSISELETPKNHFAHDALIKFEGPGWESDKVAYRFYLDSRNRNDIFAKKIDEVVLHNVGNSDLVSDSKESYTKMCDWGMDIFKVGESLGIGSIGMWADNKVNTVSKTDRVICKITTDGIIKSNILTNYQGWIIGTQKFDLNSLISISAGSRLTKEEISITGDAENICTGFAKHADCSLIKDENNLEWSYIASYGKQSLAGDNLGLALFFKKSDLISFTEDASSFITVLKLNKGKLTYYFAAAPEMELNGIKSKEEFIKYLNEVTTELSNPVVVEWK